MDIEDGDPRLQPVSFGYPEQISLMYYGAASVRFGWATGTGHMVDGDVSLLHHSHVESIVQLGRRPGQYQQEISGKMTEYTQTYDYPEARNYISPRLHFAVAKDLLPDTTYYYRVRGVAKHMWSREYSFKTLASGKKYPLRLGMIADAGQTYNSSVTYTRLREDEPQAVLHIGDLSYSDDYLTSGALFPWLLNETTPVPTPPQSFQPRWDKWGRLVTPLMAEIPFLFTPGNHEVEVQTDGSKFVSYTSRFYPNHEASGSTSPLWYSMDLGPVHVVFLTSYAPYGRDSPQYAWLSEDLAALDREATPWLIAAFHAPWYSSYKSHYMEANCQRQSMESLLYSHAVDVVLNGHVHAYERTFPVYDFQLDECGPVHLSLGDGGNIEKLNAIFADSPGNCPPIPERGPGYQPEVCVEKVFDGEYCARSQPEWSAFRQPTFGHAILEVLNDTHALFQWKRNVDAISDTADEVLFVRKPEKCSALGRTQQKNSALMRQIGLESVATS